MDTQCIHEWLPNGLWDGKTDDGKRTGGVMYKCSKCEMKVTSKKQALELGGEIKEEGVDMYGRPLKE